MNDVPNDYTLILYVRRACVAIIALSLMIGIVAILLQN